MPIDNVSQTTSASFLRAGSLAFVLSAALLLLGGCETPTGGGPAASPAAQNQTKLTKGMIADDVRAALGAPASIRPYGDQKVKSEVWKYRQTRQVTRQVAVGVQENPYTDPMTGAQTVVKTPITKNETVLIDEVLEILLIDGKVSAWKQHADTGNYFN